jgi:hypothetical protein
MAHDRDAALDQKRNCLRHAPAAFELDGAAAGFLQHARRRGKGLLFRGLIRAERQVDHHQRAP